MVVYTCEDCGKKFKDKQDYTRHINRKTSCKKPENCQKFICNLCNKEFTSQFSMKRHQREICINKYKEQLLLDKIKIMENEIKSLKVKKNKNKNNINDSSELFNLNITNDIKIDNTDNLNIKSNISNNIINSNENFEKSNIVSKNIVVNEIINDLNNSEQLINNEINTPILNEIIIKTTYEKINGYFYILQEREFIKTNENIYKIGKTSKDSVIERFKQYPNESILYGSWKVNDCNKFEKIMKNIFELKYKLRNDIGIEYFEGDLKDMLITIENNFKICFN
jgi:hypothetical protein